MLDIKEADVSLDNKLSSPHFAFCLSLRWLLVVWDFTLNQRVVDMNIYGWPFEVVLLAWRDHMWYNPACQSWHHECTAASLGELCISAIDM